MADDKKSKKPDSGIPIPPAPSARIDLPAPAPPGGQEAPAGQESVDDIMAKYAPKKPSGPAVDAVKPITEEDMHKQKASDLPGIAGMEAVSQIKHSTGKAPNYEKLSQSVGIHGSPPVFIKIDKYTDIVKNLSNLKSYALSLRDALDALADIEKELTTGISIAHKALDDFNTIIAVLDSKLLRASAIRDTEINQPQDVDKYIKGIYEQMEKIKTDLRGM